MGKMNLSIGIVSAVLGAGMWVDGNANAAQIRYFKADGGSGTAIHGAPLADSSGNNRPGYLYSGVSYVPDNWGGTALSFDGVDDQAQLIWPERAQAPSINEMNDAGAVEFWYYRPSGASNFAGFLAVHTGSANWEDQRLGVYADAGDNNYLKAVTSDGVSYSVAHTTTALITNAWTHVVFTWGGGTQQLYQNGVPLLPGSGVSNPDPISLDMANNNVYIGASYGLPSAQRYQGYLDEISFWDEKLSDAFVLQRFNAIPEPASLGLIGLGAVALASRSRVRR